MKRKLISLILGLGAVAIGSANAATVVVVDEQSQADSFSGLKSNATYSQEMLNNQSIMNRQLSLLKYRQSGMLADNSIYIGGKGEITPYWQLPSYQSSTGVALPYFDLSFTSTIGDWVTGYAQLEVNDATSSALTMPQAYFVVGNLDKSPVYFFGGKSVINFGNFYSPNNLMPTLTRIAFMQYGGNVGVGFNMDGINITGSLANGDGVALMNMGATSANQINAFAVNANYNNQFNDNSGFYVGAGYTNATGFVNSNDKMVGAVDVNAGLNLSGLNLTAEYIITTSGVSGSNATFGNNPANNGYNAFAFNMFPLINQITSVANNGTSSLMAFSASADYTFKVGQAQKDLIPYVTYSQIIHDCCNQIYSFEMGGRYNILDSVWLGGSYNVSEVCMNGNGKPTANIFMLDLTAYF